MLHYRLGFAWFAASLTVGKGHHRPERSPAASRRLDQRA